MVIDEMDGGTNEGIMRWMNRWTGWRNENQKKRIRISNINEWYSYSDQWKDRFLNKWVSKGIRGRISQNAELIPYDGYIWVQNEGYVQNYHLVSYNLESYW